MKKEIFIVNAEKGKTNPWAKFEQVFDNQFESYNKCKELEEDGWINVKWTKEFKTLDEFYKGEV